MLAEHSEMLIHNQQSLRRLHISHIAKGHENASVDTHSIRLENLQCLISEAGTKAELARRTGVSEAYLSQITSDKIGRNVGKDIARRLEKGMHKPTGWMDVPHPDRDSAQTAIQILWVPLISWAEAAALRTKSMPHETDIKIPTTAVVAGKQLSQRCFALRVTTDSMINPAGRPTYPPGCTIIVDPDRQAANGDRVIVKIPNVAEPAFKLYTVDSGRVFLRSLNPQYPSLSWESGMQVLGVIVQTVIDE
jgi:SOS-response transcriptional repressor LexA